MTETTVTEIPADCRCQADAPAARPRPKYPHHPLDVATAAAREYADRFYPGAKRVSVAIRDAGGRKTVIEIPPAEVLEGLAVDDGPQAGALTQSACAAIILAVLAESEGSLQATEIEDVLKSHTKYAAYSLSSITKTLAELKRVGLVVNPKNTRLRGYRLAT